jgi:hypothetical protein
MVVHDCKNAHHAVKLTDSSHKFCNSKLFDSTGRRRIIQGIGCDQGISAIALFFRCGLGSATISSLVKLG